MQKEVIHKIISNGPYWDQKSEYIIIRDDNFLISSIYSDNKKNNWHTIYNYEDHIFPVFTLNHALYLNYYLQQKKLFINLDDLYSKVNWSFRNSNELINIKNNSRHYSTLNEDIYVPGFDESVGNYFHFFSHILPKFKLYFELKKIIPGLKIFFNIKNAPSWKKELFFEILDLKKNNFLLQYFFFIKVVNFKFFNTFLSL